MHRVEAKDASVLRLLSIPSELNGELRIAELIYKDREGDVLILAQLTQDIFNLK
jgi:hypothetical protein